MYVIHVKNVCFLFLTTARPSFRGPSFHLAKGTWTGAKLCLWACNRNNIASGGWGEYDYIHISHKKDR